MPRKTYPEDIFYRKLQDRWQRIRRNPTYLDVWQRLSEHWWKLEDANRERHRASIIRAKRFLEAIPEAFTHAARNAKLVNVDERPLERNWNGASPFYLRLFRDSEGAKAMRRRAVTILQQPAGLPMEYYTPGKTEFRLSAEGRVLDDEARDLARRLRMNYLWNPGVALTEKDFRDIPKRHCRPLFMPDVDILEPPQSHDTSEPPRLLWPDGTLRLSLDVKSGLPKSAILAAIETILDDIYEEIEPDTNIFNDTKYKIYDMHMQDGMSFKEIMLELQKQGVRNADNQHRIKEMFRSAQSEIESIL